MTENLEKAKKISELLKDSQLPDIAKSQVVLGVAMGVDPDVIIKGAVSTVNRIETAKAETETPKPEPQPDYTETERKIADMLQENTGIHMLDSGSAYGRHWQENRLITDFRQNPNPIVRINAPHYYTDSEGKKRKMPPEISIYYDTFHYLNNFLELDEKAKELQKQFEEYAELPENQDVGWLALAKEFLQNLHKENKDSEYYGITNTYNYDNIIYQVLQYGIIEIDSEDYILLQIHNGCDVRGGYTKPQFFRLLDLDYFDIAQSEIRMFCKCGHCSAYSDDSGYNWYAEDNGNKINPIKRIRFKRHPQKEYDKDSVYCKKCGSEITFYVTEDF